MSTDAYDRLLALDDRFERKGRIMPPDRLLPWLIKAHGYVATLKPKSKPAARGK